MRDDAWAAALDLALFDEEHAYARNDEDDDARVDGDGVVDDEQGPAQDRRDHTTAANRPLEPP